MDALLVYDKKIADLATIGDRIPVTFQTPYEKPDMAMEDKEMIEGKNTSMILEHAKKALKTSLEDFEEISNNKPIGDLEHDNRLVWDEQDYLKKRVPAQFDSIMFYIEALIHRDDWDAKDFGKYKQIYKKGKELEGWDQASILAELRMCLMWAIPQEEYVREAEFIQPRFSSANRTVESSQIA